MLNGQRQFSGKGGQSLRVHVHYGNSRNVHYGNSQNTNNIRSYVVIE